MTAPAGVTSWDGRQAKRQELNSLLAQLKNERSSFISHWRELSDYIQPTRARFTVTDSSRGQRRSRSIIDSTGTIAARTQAAGMMSGLSNPARPWYNLTTPDPDLADDPAVKEWLHIVTQRMRTLHSRSNLYKVLPLMFADVGTFSTSAVGIFEHPDTTLRCKHFPIGSYMIACDDDGRVNTFAREFQMTVRQIVEKFGGGDMKNSKWEGISNNTKRAWDRKDYQKWMEVVQVISPNDDYDGVSRLSHRKKYYQCYFEVSTDADKVLEESGFDEFPILAPRWEVTGEDVYGTNCPGMTALGDIKALQHGERRAAQGLDKIINPPMKGPPSMRTVKSSLLPGDVTYTVNPEGFTPVHEIKHDIFTPLERKQEQIRQRINRAYFADLFLMLDSLNEQDPRKTATEILERKEEKMLVLGPVLEQINDDAFDPLIDRTFAIMQRAGMVPPPPPELEGAVLKVEYISVMAQAQKATGLASIDRFAGFVGNLAQYDPQILDKVDRDELVDRYGDMSGVPPKVVVSDDDVKAIREERAQSQKAAEAAAHAESLSKSAKNLAESPTGGAPNALTDLLQSGQSPMTPAEPALAS